MHVDIVVNEDENFKLTSKDDGPRIAVLDPVNYVEDVIQPVVEEIPVVSVAPVRTGGHHWFDGTSWGTK